LIPEFHKSVEVLLPELATNEKTKDLVDKELILAIGKEVGRQMARPNGPNFTEFRDLPNLVILEDTAVFTIMTEVKNYIVKGTMSVI